jgi:phosphatidylserine synthase
MITLHEQQILAYFITVAISVLIFSHILSTTPKENHILGKLGVCVLSLIPIANIAVSTCALAAISIESLMENPK